MAAPQDVWYDGKKISEAESPLLQALVNEMRANSEILHRGLNIPEDIEIIRSDTVQS